MKSLREFIEDAMPGFIIPRAQMPQINPKTVTTNLDKAGIIYRIAFDDPANYKPTQVDINKEKVEEIVSWYEAGKYDLQKNPVIVSKDGFVVDGHHRWAAAKHCDVEIKILEVDLNITDCLRFFMDNKE